MKATYLTRLLPATLALAFALPVLAEGGWRDDPSAREQRGSGSSESRGDNRGNGNDSRNDNRGGDNRGGDNRGGDNRGGDNRGGDNRGDGRVGDSRGGNNNHGDNNRGNDHNRGHDNNHGNDNRGNHNGGSWVNNGGWRNDQPVRSEWHGPRDDHHNQYRREERHEEIYRYGYYRDDRDYFHRHGYSRLDIPVAYYPPAGWCRIWYPGRPAAHQPPPVQCGVVVPMGAWLLEHPHNHEHIYVRTRDEERSGASIVGEFRISDGAFIRIVLD
ncbi:hypothetical protein [Parathalassolituus penaei]|uniref:Uncharacterized protein n=1 Tax=Parathalassolituus penaei TaxID=2997323 RepID=A0A9X3EC52_9GAMM|nr:hypothetical protein [Parathalassolituus penaei]MCY0964144.1 hypothetical protein [Parathalassolituus penaei]